MAKATIHVSAFNFEVEVEALDEDELFDQIDQFELGEKAMEYAKVSKATYDKPEPDEDDEPEEEDAASAD